MPTVTGGEWAPQGEPSSRARILRTYVAARGALGLALLLLPWAAVFLMGGRLPWPMLMVSLAYAAQAVSLWLLHVPEHDGDGATLSRRQWWLTIGVDLLAFSLLRLLDPTPQLNYAALLVLPVLMAGVLSPRVPALATASVGTLVLLLSVWLQALDEGDVLLQLSQAGLAGAGMFLITLLANELATRLAGEERSARHSLEIARQQAQLNRIVIEEMAEGVLVVDRRCRLRAVNPAGRQMLGRAGEHLLLPCDLSAVPDLAGLAQAVQSAYAIGRWPESARELVLGDRDGHARAAQVRARFTRRRDLTPDREAPEDYAVLFLEDLRAVRQRQRKDKLAAMGRVSAGIAHEIRNPLAAVAQANALMQEEPLPPTQQQLARIVQDNVARLKRIVDEVMAVAPDGDFQRVAADATETVASTCADWRRTALSGGDAQRRLVVQLPARSMSVWFDGEHLRRVLVNLLDNASRHATDQPGAVVVSLAPVDGTPVLRLTVASDGPAVTPDIERHLFEPFFSSRSRGSGLGLYICRELCERHGASIEFRLAPADERHRNRFSVLMRAVAGGPGASAASDPSAAA